MKGLQHRLFGPVLVMLAATVLALAYAAYQAFTGTSVLQVRVREVQRASELVVHLNALRSDTQVNVLRLVAEPDGRVAEELERAADEAGRVVAELGTVQVSPTAARLYEQFLTARERDGRARAQLLGAARAGDRRTLNLAYRRWDLARSRGDALLEDVSAYHLKQLQHTLREVDRRRSRSVALLAFAIGLSFTVVLLYASVVQRTVVGPITSLTRAASGLPGSRFDPRDAVDRDDEIGVLARTLQRVVEEMQRVNEKLRDADRRKDEFLSILSHELRNPLTPIRTAIYILNRADPASDESRRAREVIDRQAQHLTRLVDELLDVTRIARGKVELRRERVDLAELVRRTADDHRSVLSEGGVHMAVEAPDGSVWIEGDRTRIAQVVGNLLQNAGKFTPPGGEVRVGVQADGSHAHVQVRDTGIGIEPELLDRIFEPFVQSDRSLARTQGGLGLGLAVVKGLVELHGGAVRAASAGSGRGAEFTASLPLSGHGACEPRRAEIERERPVHARRVLVVDDNRDAASALADLVALLGHAPDVAHDGPSAIEKADTTEYHLVLCDLGLPGMSGYDVARALRARTRGTQLIALSGYAQPEDVARAADAGFDGHLAKPPDPREIERLLG